MWEHPRLLIVKTSSDVARCETTLVEALAGMWDMPFEVFELPGPDDLDALSQFGGPWSVVYVCGLAERGKHLRGRANDDLPSIILPKVRLADCSEMCPVGERSVLFVMSYAVRYGPARGASGSSRSSLTLG